MVDVATTVATAVLGCEHLSIYRMTSCCDFDFLVAIVLVVFCLTGFNLMSRPQGDVATSFAAHFFSSGHNLSSLLQLIFLLPTFILGRDLKVMS